MKVTFLLVGKTTDQHIEALIKEYTKRLSHYLSFEIIVIPEIKKTKSLSLLQQKEREGELILKRITTEDYVVLLDEGGKEYRSIEFATYLEKLQHIGMRRLVFIVGGAYGFSESVYRCAKEKLSLSRMTFSHQMIRILFIEQVYRAMTILRGEPYHHE